ncbi:hypothetical protein M427DRAFT_66058 [Gonapodya prolifera JEL478]|uniref:Uncharacterized protein n=1 Tax=Gonapodya prolifera (strain JEL478) TaxID=1344416 RepID=A0A139AX58_GONPJ|nr:hypothetical protein M427DRAFT_66058 [Gonapodya prolifera JEL478]|eukprot:KXS21326.1 hypothetical protein M427DRAFT_66058 [Gonapodya prolifera JEL478]
MPANARLSPRSTRAPPSTSPSPSSGQSPSDGNSDTDEEAHVLFEGHGSRIRLAYLFLYSGVEPRNYTVITAANPPPTDGTSERAKATSMSDMDRSRKSHPTFPSTELGVHAASRSDFVELEHPNPVKIVPHSNSFSFFSTEDSRPSSGLTEPSRSDSSNSDLKLSRFMYKSPSPQPIVTNTGSSQNLLNFRKSDARLTPLSVSTAVVGSLVKSTAIDTIPSGKVPPNSTLQNDGDLFWVKSGKGTLFCVGLLPVRDTRAEAPQHPKVPPVDGQDWLGDSDSDYSSGADTHWGEEALHHLRSSQSSLLSTGRKAPDAEERMLGIRLYPDIPYSFLKARSESPSQRSSYPASPLTNGTAFFTSVPPSGCVRPTAYRHKSFQVVPPPPTTQSNVRTCVADDGKAPGRQNRCHRGGNGSAPGIENRERRASYDSATIIFRDESEDESGTVAGSPKKSERDEAEQKGESIKMHGWRKRLPREEIGGVKARTSGQGGTAKS